MSQIVMQAWRRYLSTTVARNAGHVEGPSAVSGIHEGGYKIWKKLTFFVALPSIVLCAVNCVLQHQEHAKHEKPKVFVKYDYLAVRTKRFPWGDGNKSLIHNPHANALPTGYEH